MACPYCRNENNQVKAGRSGERQRWKCNACQRRYLAEAKERGTPLSLRQRALELHAQGTSIQAISRETGVSGQSVRNWLRTSRDTVVPEVPHEAKTDAAETHAPALPAPMKRRPTITDVARQAGVSRSTVSNILNSKGRMSRATRARVQSAMDALHFSPSALVRAIHSQRTGIFGVLLFGLTAIGYDGTVDMTALLLAGIAAAADAAGYNILLYTGWEQGAGRQDALKFLSGHIDGLIWVAPAFQEPALERLAEAGLPVVALLSRHVPDTLGFVNVDNIAGMRDMVVYLGGLGHRRIAYLGNDRDSNFLDRRNGYRAGLAVLGLPHDPALDIWAGFDPAAFRNAVQAWLHLSAPPTAIVAPSDSWAEAVGQIVREAGLRVPEDISVTGFDDTPGAQHILGGLTTVRQPLRDMGRSAGECLLSLIGGATAGTCRLTLPTEIVARSSANVPAASRCIVLPQGGEG